MLTVLRGLPGSGKSHRIVLDRTPNRLTVVASADLWFETTGTPWAGKHLEEAHSWAKEQAREAFERLGDKEVRVYADNTHSRLWEYRPYVEMATEAGHSIHIVDLFDAGKPLEFLAARNIHTVPQSKITQMAERWEITEGAPRPNDRVWQIGLDGVIVRRGEYPEVYGPTLILSGGRIQMVETCGSLFEARRNLSRYLVAIEQHQAEELEWPQRHVD